MKKEFESDVFAEDIIDGCLGEASGKAIGKVIDKARPNNYSSFRNKAKKFLPEITQDQTRNLMQGINRGLTHAKGSSTYMTSVILSIW